MYIPTWGTGQIQSRSSFIAERRQTVMKIIDIYLARREKGAAQPAAASFAITANRQEQMTDLQPAVSDSQSQ